MKRIALACGLFGALLVACGCGKDKAEVPSWFKGEKKDGGPVATKNTPRAARARPPEKDPATRTKDVSPG